jgi:hypothetical protein
VLVTPSVRTLLAGDSNDRNVIRETIKADKIRKSFSATHFTDVNLLMQYIKL